MDLAIRQRWKTEEGERLARAIQRQLREGGPLRDLSFGVVGGRQDLRGFTLTEQVEPINGAVLRSIDLSDADLSHLRFRDCVMEDCLFTGAELVDWRFWRTRVDSSSFGEADLQNAALGAWSEGRGNTFEKVDFSKANMHGASSSAATYRDCDFSFANLEGVNFWQSSLIRCTFAGPLRRAIFDGRMLGEGKPDANPMTDVDFTAAEFSGCSFRGVDFRSVRLPRDDALILVQDTKQVDQALEDLSRRSGEAGAALAARILMNARKWLPTLFNLRDFPSAAPLVAEVLRAHG
jgi:uncharacterized protein YjbI with pentapeptide repeats